MAKIRTVSDAQALLDTDFAWRLQEVSDVKTSIKSAGPRNRTLIRAGVALLYAHWEGFIKRSSQIYLEYVASQRLKYRELKPCFAVFGLKAQLNFITGSRKHSKSARIIEFLLTEMDSRAVLLYEDSIDTESNLSSVVFQGIAESLGINYRPYETKNNLIDKSLLDRRNKIAHGEFLDIVADDYAKSSDEVVSLMRQYKDDIENALVLKSYLYTS